MLNISKSLLFVFLIAVGFSTTAFTVDARVSYPKEPLKQDDAYQKILEFHSRIKSIKTPTEGHDDSNPLANCTFWAKTRSFSDECRKLYKDNRHLAHEFLEWARSTKDYSLRSSMSLEQHSRVPYLNQYGVLAKMSYVGEGHQIENKNVSMALMDLTIFPVASAIENFENGKTKAALADLNVISDAFIFLNQNACSFNQMSIAQMVFKRFLQIVETYMPKENVEAEIIDFLPKSSDLISSAKSAIGGEWYDMKNGQMEMIEQNRKEHKDDPKLEEQIKQLESQMLGRSSEKVSEIQKLRNEKEFLTYIEQAEIKRRKYSGYDGSRKKQALIKAGKIERPSIFEMTVIDSFSRYFNRTGSFMNEVEATKVILASRSYYKKHNEWPTTVKQLVPKYLEVWPKTIPGGEDLILNAKSLTIEIPSAKNNQMGMSAYHRPMNIRPR
ncbi:MAG: hypothetical protein KDD48_01590 [Bdellovibrionales bacterium]|nr:hypothetical protein [Bdellovibrionales bacterium]